MSARTLLAGVALATATLAPAPALAAWATTAATDRPEGVLVDGARTFVSTTSGALDLVAGSGRPSTIYVFDTATGTRRSTIVLQGERTSGSALVTGVQGAAGMAMDAAGRLYVADGQGRVVRFTEGAGGIWSQETYATVPDLPACRPVLVPAPCSATPDDRRPLVNELEFGLDGTLFVTDSFQATVFRVPAGGGAAQIHITDPRLSGAIVGPNGIALDRDGRTLTLAVTQSTPGGGELLRLPTTAPVSLSPFAATPADPVDGLAYGADGRLFAAFSQTAEIGVFAPDGTLERRIGVPEGDEPAGVAFVPGTTAIIVANHAFDAIDDAPRVVSRIDAGTHGQVRVRPVVRSGG